MNFPHLGKELVLLLDQDQEETQKFFRLYASAEPVIRNKKRTELSIKCRARAQRVLEILDEIKAPIIDNIGKEGSEAISIIALHSSLKVMKKILQHFEKCFIKDSSSIFNEAIPTLTDRILIIEGKNQTFGTQWMLSEGGKPFLFPVDNFDEVSMRRSKFGLGPIKSPIDLATSSPTKKKRLATANDQKQPSKKEFDEYAKYFLD